ncbi:MAG: isoprenylcysteine carboxylmethyltransferase family protein, partial [Vicinamibacterales bacterium]
LLVIPSAGRTWPMFYTGAALVAVGEALRLWAVHHIGVISRTRSDRLGPLISSGPFARVRNPLYLGNIGLWAGFTVSAGLLWMTPVVLGLLALEYHAIVRWEETLLSARIGGPYRRYVERVPRWFPRWRADLPDAPGGRETQSPSPAPADHAWRHTLGSERSTLVAIALGYLLLWVKG